MKIMSFNTQSCLNYREQKRDFQIMADSILACGADFVGLNEIRGAGENAWEFADQTKKLSELTGMAHYFFAPAIYVHGGGPYGNAVLSKIPFVSVENIQIPDPAVKTGGKYYETRCLIKAKLENGLTVLVTHMGLNVDEREAAVKTILENMTPEKCVVMGDFNALPEEETLNPLRERFVDAATLFEKPLLSFDSVNPTMKIDYIFVTPDITLKQADIPEIIASDHRPHTAEIEF